MTINKANPVDLRKALGVANTLAQAGIDFVPVAVTSEQQKMKLTAMSMAALGALEARASVTGGDNANTAIPPTQ